MAKKKKYAIPRHYGELGQFLCELRLKKDLSQREVSQKLGYSSAQFISNFECGIAPPPLAKLKALVKIYDAPIEKVLDLILECERKKIGAVLHGNARA